MQSKHQGKEQYWRFQYIQIAVSKTSELPLVGQTSYSSSDSSSSSLSSWQSHS